MDLRLTHDAPPLLQMSADHAKRKADEAAKASNG
jgi:hypothetical protein